MVHNMVPMVTAAFGTKAAWACCLPLTASTARRCLPFGHISSRRSNGSRVSLDRAQRLQPMTYGPSIMGP